MTQEATMQQTQDIDRTEDLKERALEYLPLAEEFDRLTVHVDDGVRSPVVVFTDSLPLLGEYLTHEADHYRRDAYSYWCGDTEGWVLRHEVDADLIDYDADDAESVARLAAVIGAQLRAFAPSATDEEIADVTAAVIERI